MGKKKKKKRKGRTRKQWRNNHSWNVGFQPDIKLIWFELGPRTYQHWGSSILCVEHVTASAVCLSELLLLPTTPQPTWGNTRSHMPQGCPCKLPHKDHLWLGTGSPWRGYSVWAVQRLWCQGPTSCIVKMFRCCLPLTFLSLTLKIFTLLLYFFTGWFYFASKDSNSLVGANDLKEFGSFLSHTWVMFTSFFF